MGTKRSSRPQVIRVLALMSGRLPLKSPKLNWLSSTLLRKFSRCSGLARMLFRRSWTSSSVSALAS
ncbi:hypothetical protein D3C81_2160140 [compost metagenome]